MRGFLTGMIAQTIDVGREGTVIDQLHEAIFGSERKPRHFGDRIGQAADHVIGQAATRAAVDFQGRIAEIRIIGGFLIANAAADKGVNRQADLRVIETVEEAAKAPLMTKNARLGTRIKVKFMDGGLQEVAIQLHPEAIAKAVTHTSQSGVARPELRAAANTVMADGEMSRNGVLDNAAAECGDIGASDGLRMGHDRHHQAGCSGKYRT